MNGVTTAFWGMTINNYDEVDMALVKNGYPDYMREIVWTLEKGAEGTEHIQAWIKLQRQQRLSFVKKLFPRGHFKALTSDEYVHNTKMYAQKLDSTAESAVTHKFHDPIPSVESLIKRVVERVITSTDDWDSLEEARIWVEKEMVMEDYKLAKIFVSAVYKQMWKHFGWEMYENLCEKFHHTHTHTHSEELFSHQESINADESKGNDESREEDAEGGRAKDACEDFEDGGSSSDEGYDESSGSDGSQAYDQSD